MTREASKTREWEKQRRERLKDAYQKLGKLLPSYDPSLTLSQIETLLKATEYIEELQKSVKDLRESGTSNKDAAVAEHLKKAQDRIKKLLVRNEQLAKLLRDAGIRLPSYVGTVKKFKRNLPWANRISSDQAKIFQKKEQEKENENATLKPKRKIKAFPRSRRKKALQCKKNALNKCLIVVSQANQPCLILNSALPAKNPIIKPTNLGPGTLILSNGTILPITTPLPSILPLPTPPKINFLLPSSTNSVISQNDKILNSYAKIRPKFCTTCTTQVNKVPIPALTSKYSANSLIFGNKVVKKVKKRGLEVKNKILPKKAKVSLNTKIAPLKTVKNDNILTHNEEIVKNNNLAKEKTDFLAKPTENSDLVEKPSNKFSFPSDSTNLTENPLQSFDIGKNLLEIESTCLKIAPDSNLDKKITTFDQKDKNHPKNDENIPKSHENTKNLASTSNILQNTTKIVSQPVSNLIAPQNAQNILENNKKASQSVENTLKPLENKLTVLENVFKNVESIPKSAEIKKTFEICPPNIYQNKPNHFAKILDNTPKNLERVAPPLNFDIIQNSYEKQVTKNYNHSQNFGQVFDDKKNAFENGKNSFGVTKNNFEVPKNSFEVLKNSFEVPKNSFEVSKNTFEASKNHFEAPKQNFESHKQNFEIPKRNNFEAAKNSFEAPKNIFGVTNQNFEAPKNNFESPKQNFEIHKQNFEIPKQNNFETAKKNFVAAKNTFEAPKNNFQAPQQNFEIPKQPNFEAAKNNFEAAKNSFEAPKNIFEVTKQHFGAPKQNFEAPKNNFESPKQNFEIHKQNFEIPKQNNFETAKNTFVAAKNSFEAPKNNFEIPKQNFETPKNNFDPPKNIFEANKNMTTNYVAPLVQKINESNNKIGGNFQNTPPPKIYQNLEKTITKNDYQNHLLQNTNNQNYIQGQNNTQGQNNAQSQSIQGQNIQSQSAQGQKTETLLSIDKTQKAISKTEDISTNIFETTPKLKDNLKNPQNSQNTQSLSEIDKTLELNISHELSNDIFASLQVPTGCQNPESTSPTAAFLLAFPLVSSITGVKVTEVIEDDTERETPTTILQIGNIEKTDNLTPSMLLDNMSFFGNAFGSFDKTPSKKDNFAPVFGASGAKTITLTNPMSYEEDPSLKTKPCVQKATWDNFPATKSNITNVAKYPEQIYTNSYNSYYPDTTWNQNYYKNTPQENFNYQKSAPTNNFPPKNKATPISKVNKPQKTVNWMTTPEKDTNPYLPFDFNTNNYFPSLDDPKFGPKLDDTSTDNFTWSPSKLPQFLDTGQNQNYVPSTLPTLVGDLALGQTFSESKTRVDKNKSVSYKQNDHFFSVSSLVDPKIDSQVQGVKKIEGVGAKIGSRRGSNSRKTPSKVGAKRKETRETSSKKNLFPEYFPETTPSKRVKNNYSAEALISENSKKYPSKNVSTYNISENFMPHFGVEQNYVQNNQNYVQNLNFNPSQGGNFQVQNNSYATATTNFPTLTNSYINDLPNNDFIPDFNIFNPISNAKRPKKEPCGTPNFKKLPPNSKKNASFDLPFLPAITSMSSPLLPDDFHSHSNFLPHPTSSQIYPSCKNTPNSKIGHKNEVPVSTANWLAPLTSGTGSASVFTSRSNLANVANLPNLANVANVPNPEISPPSLVASGNLTNFNLSAIFPEMNKGPVVNEIYPEIRQNAKDSKHSLNNTMTFSKPNFSFSYNHVQNNNQNYTNH